MKLYSMILKLLNVLFCGCLEVIRFWSCWRFYSEAVLKVYHSGVSEGFILRQSFSCMILELLQVLFWRCLEAVWFWGCWRFYSEDVWKMCDSKVAEGCFILRLCWSYKILKLLKVLFWGCPEAVWFWCCWRFYSAAVLKTYDSDVAEGFILRLSRSYMILKLLRVLF